jgi:ElaA protein
LLKFFCKSFGQLSLKEAHDLFELRSEVFVLEQKCVYQDIDGEDPNAHHILGKDSSNKIVAYARILPKGKPYASFVAIGRLVVSQKIRGNKHGHNLVKKKHRGGL